MLDLSHAALSKDGGSAALHDIRHAVELGGLAAQPELVDVHAVTFQIFRHDGVAAAGAGEACDLGEGADLDGALAGTLDLEDAAGQLAVGDEALVSGIVEDDGVVLSGVLHPCLELVAGVGSAGGIVGATDVDDVSLHAVVGHPEEAVLLTGAAIDDLAAIGDVVVHIGGVDGVRHEDGVVHVEQAQHIGKVALCTVGDEDLVLVQLGAAACVVALNGLLEEGVALLGAVAVEAFLGTHLGDGVMHGVHDALGQRLGHIADAQTDDLLLRVCLLIGGDFVGNVHKEVAGLQLIVMFVHFHDTFPQFFLYKWLALSGRSASGSLRGKAKNITERAGMLKLQ